MLAAGFHRLTRARRWLLQVLQPCQLLQPGQQPGSPAGTHHGRCRCLWLHPRTQLLQLQQQCCGCWPLATLLRLWQPQQELLAWLQQLKVA